MQKGAIRVNTENIFPIIKKFLYSDHDIFLRELISNAVDATRKLKTLSSIGDAKGEIGELAITVTLDKEAKTITISDKGVGMTAEEVDKYINQVAFSSAEEFVSKYKGQADANIIGHFGLGFYSAFMVSEKVEIRSKSYRDDATAVPEPEHAADHVAAVAEPVHEAADVGRVGAERGVVAEVEGAEGAQRGMLQNSKSSAAHR